MQLTVNGTPRQVGDDASLAGLIGTLSDRTSGIAVAVNAAVVPRSEWETTELREGDRVDVVTAVQGG